MTTQNLNPDHLRAVLSVFGHDDYSAGGFADALLEAMVRADLENLDKLAKAFPTFGLPFQLVKLTPLGTRVVQTALAFMDAGLALTPRAIRPPNEDDRAGWLYEDVRDGIELADIIERERKLSAELEEVGIDYAADPFTTRARDMSKPKG